MKANAPEKIFLNWTEYPLEEIQVEYTRTDAFIEKAVGRLIHYLDNSVWVTNDVGVREKEVIIEDFVKYMKGE